MEEEKSAWLTETNRPLTSISGARSTRRTQKNTKDSHFEKLKRAAGMAADQLICMLSDDMQFRRHLFQEKSTGEISETVLESRNIKHLRETISAIRDLADTVRDLYGLLPPDAESSLKLQIKKLELDEKKLSGAQEASESGVVLLPLPDESKA